MDSLNPYQPPEISDRPARRRTRSPLAGPILAVGVFAFVCAAGGSSMTVVPEKEWVVRTAVAILTIAGSTCFGTSFYLWRGHRHDSVKPRDHSDQAE